MLLTMSTESSSPGNELSQADMEAIEGKGMSSRGSKARKSSSAITERRKENNQQDDL